MSTSPQQQETQDPFVPLSVPHYAPKVFKLETVRSKKRKRVMRKECGCSTEYRRFPLSWLLSAPYDVRIWRRLFSPEQFDGVYGGYCDGLYPKHGRRAL